MLLPVSRMLSLTARGTKKLLDNNSCRYLAKKRMELSTEIPNVILKMRAVLAFSGILKYPIRPAVIIKAIRLGISEIKIIRTLANRMAIESVIRIQARIKLSVRFSIRNLLPLINILDEPVTETLTVSLYAFSVFLSSVTRTAALGSIILCTSESILTDPISAICMEMRILLYVESTNELNSPLLSDCPFK